MARYSPGVYGHGLYRNGSTITAPPLTMAAWVNVEDNGAVSQFMGITSTSSDNPAYAVRARFDQPNKEFQIFVRGDTPTPYVTISGPAMPTGRWVHVAGVFASTTSRTGYLDGVSVGTDTTLVPAGTVNQTTLMWSNRNAVPNFHAQGSIAHAAMWRSALAASQIVLLARGASPLGVSRWSLAAYWPLRGYACDSPERDFAFATGVRDLVVNGMGWHPDPYFLVDNLYGQADPLSGIAGVFGTIPPLPPPVVSRKRTFAAFTGFGTAGLA